MSRHHHHFAVVLTDYAIIGISLSFFLIIISLLIFLCYRNHQHKHSPPCTAAVEETSVTSLLPAGSFPMTDLEAATDGFHRSWLIGKGRTGTVYKASTTAHGTARSVAIKRLHSSLVLTHPGPAFATAIKSLAFVAGHPNVVPVLGTAEAPGERVVISEYVRMKTLETLMYGVDAAGGGGHLISWCARVKIAVGIARGVEHLHGSTALGIVHGCLKPCNVFVDDNNDHTARVSDYGLGFLCKGMEGYVDQEGHEACRENDVYAFGVIVLELLSGRKSEAGRLVEWALPLIRASKVEEVLDKRMEFPFGEIQVLIRAAKAAAACVGNSRGYRLTMAELVEIFNRLEMELCV